MEQIQIYCKECGDGTMMNRVPGTATMAKYRCRKNHTKELKKDPIRRIPINRPGPPDAA